MIRFVLGVLLTEGFALQPQDQGVIMKTCNKTLAIALLWCAAGISVAMASDVSAPAAGSEAANADQWSSLMSSTRQSLEHYIALVQQKSDEILQWYEAWKLTEDGTLDEAKQGFVDTYNQLKDLFARVQRELAAALRS